VVDGRIGAFAAIARRRGRDWFVGAINAGTPRALALSLAFLPAGQAYDAHLYADDATVKTRTRVAVTTRRVTSATVLDLPLPATGGAALWLTPAAAN
jgi:alpha-glucosidase